MQIYKKKDVDMVLEYMDSIQDELKVKKMQLFEPKKDEQQGVMKVIHRFVKEKKRKLYGGYAINLLIKAKNPKDTFYNEDLEVPDVDFYSPDPIGDLIELCNRIVDAGYTNVEGREAQHLETYKIFVNRKDYIDISYTPKNIYNRIPFKEVEGFILADPSFILIDYYRIFTDPLLSYWRFDKAFKRFFTLQKHYPINKIEQKIVQKNTKTNEKLLEKTFNILTSLKTIIFIGDYLYNYFLDESKPSQKYIKMLKIHRYEVVSSNYKEDVQKIIDQLKEFAGEEKNKIYVEEYYPFFQYAGRRVKIKYEDIELATIFDYNKRCIPYLIVPIKSFGETVKVHKDKKMVIGTFDFNILMTLVGGLLFRVNKNKDGEHYYRTMLSHLIELRKNYLDKNKMDMFDESLFKEFSLECLGETIPLDREWQKLIEKRKKKNMPYVWKYEPEKNRKNRNGVHIKFTNSSGNQVRNEKNLIFNAGPVPVNNGLDIEPVEQNEE